MTNVNTDRNARLLAQRAILYEWDRWVESHPEKAKDAIGFFRYLQTAKPLLLEFPCASHKWGAVQSMLIDGKRLKEPSR